MLSKRNNNKYIAAIKKGSPENFNEQISPMLATHVSKIPQDAGWIFEIKWDGYRILAHKFRNQIRLNTRNFLNYSKKYEVVAEAMKEINSDVILDGEVVLLDKNGKPDFNELQGYNGKGDLVYYAFDIIWINGYSLVKLPLIERREILSKVVNKNSIIRISESFDNGVALFKEINKQKLEGIVAKKTDSKYLPGKRSNDWQKITTSIKNEYVIGGWTESEHSRKFRSLLFGEYRKGKLYFVGHSGGGYKEKDMAEIYRRLKKLEIKNKPFVNEVDTETKVHWVNPKLVGEFRFATWTKAGKIRKPAVFLGFRPDKSIIDSGDNGNNFKKELPLIKKKIITSNESNWPKLESEKVISSNSLKIKDDTIIITNLEKEIWKGVTKFDLINYYINISNYILPHLKNRPLSLHIKLKGPYAPGFYIKDMESRAPSYASVYPVRRKHKKEGKRDMIEYLVCNNIATLIYLINLGCIDINPWTSRIMSPLYPDYIVIDLDPSDDDFQKVITTALAAKKYFDKIELQTFIKTSGKSGLHILIPCEGFTFSQARAIAEIIADKIHKMVPAITTTEISVDLRGNKLYIDPNQNDDADTLASPYSVRPANKPQVSTPLEWKEINSNLSPAQFTIESIFPRLNKKKDLFKKLLSKNIQKSNKKILWRIIEKS
jgi:bifunctional non-homologous end joining protein LigD